MHACMLIYPHTNIDPYIRYTLIMTPSLTRLDLILLKLILRILLLYYYYYYYYYY